MIHDCIYLLFKYSLKDLYGNNKKKHVVYLTIPSLWNYFAYQFFFVTQNFLHRSHRDLSH